MRATSFALALAVVAQLAAPAHAGRGTAAFRLLADDTRIVVVADVARARSSPIFQKGYELASDESPLVASLKLDKNVDTIVLASTGTDNKHDLVVLEGKVDKLVPEVKKRATGTETHGGITYWKTSHGDAAVLEKRLVIATTGDMPQVIDRAADKKRKKAPSTVRAQLASATATGAAVAVVVIPDESMRTELSKQLGVEPRVGSVTLAMASKLVMECKLQFADDASAEKANKALEGLLSADLRDRLEGIVGKEFADSIAIDRDHAVTRVSATMSADEVDKVLSVARLLL